MTRSAFDVWIEQHYDELLAVACKVTNDQDEAEDALQAGLAAMVGSPQLARISSVLAWPQAVKFVTGAAWSGRRAMCRNKALKRESKIFLNAGGFIGRVPSRPTEDKR